MFLLQEITRMKGVQKRPKKRYYISLPDYIWMLLTCLSNIIKKLYMSTLFSDERKQKQYFEKQSTKMLIKNKNIRKQTLTLQNISSQLNNFFKADW